MRTCAPMTAETWAIPCPIVPAPMTVIERTCSGEETSVTAGQYARMRAVRTSVLMGFLLAGCSFHSSSAPTDGHGSDSGMIDAPTDAPVDAELDGPPDAMPDAPRQDFGTGVWTVHVPTLPTAGVALPATIDTGTSQLCSIDAAFVDASQPASCVIVGTTITMGGKTDVRGP